MNHEFVTVKTCATPTEANIIRSLLESEEIFCFLQDELTAQVQPLYTTAIGGIKLQVRHNDAERAVVVLKEAGYATDEDYQPSKSEVRLYKILSRIPWVRRIYK